MWFWASVKSVINIFTTWNKRYMWWVKVPNFQSITRKNQENFAKEIQEATILVKRPWDSRNTSLAELSVVSYCYQIIVLSTRSLAPNQCWAKLVRNFLPAATLSRGRGDGVHFYTGHEICFKLELKSILDNIRTVCVAVFYLYSSNFMLII